MKQKNEINRATNALLDVFGHLWILFSKLDVSLSLFLFTTVHVGNEGQDSTTVQSDPLLLWWKKKMAMLLYCLSLLARFVS